MVSFNKADLEFILAQIRLAETGQPSNPQLAFGLRTVDGTNNNLVVGTTTNGSADVPFPRVTAPVFGAAEPMPANFFYPGSPAGMTATTYAQGPAPVFDSQPRTISNLISDQSPSNAAAVEVALTTIGNADPAANAQIIATAYLPVADALGAANSALNTWNALQITAGATPAAIDAAHTAYTTANNAATALATAFQTQLNTYGLTLENGSLQILNVTPDAGLSAPFNTWMTLFGQFFDHGLDLVTKSATAGKVYIPLLPDDPLYVDGGSSNFMVLTRSVVDANGNGTNTITAFVDQSQTYTSHPSHQVFLREYQVGVDGMIHSTGRMLDHISSDGSRHMPTWGDVKANALSLGILLTDADVGNIPLLATDAYGNFIPGANGHVQMVKLVGGIETLVEAGTALSPVGTDGSVSTGHAFLNDIANNAAPVISSTGDLMMDADTVAGNAIPIDAMGHRLTYDNELLDAHYIAGDGRVNENIGLTAVHEVFHLEHNRLIEQTKQMVLDELANGDTAFASEWVLAGANLSDGIQDNEWNGERLFQTAKFGTETQYQHLVFEEFARKVAPTIHLFGNLQINLDPAITAEFAHAVYRFGHSMLDENINRYEIGADGTPVMDANGKPVLNQIGLIDAFLNPLAFAAAGADAAGQIVLGSVNQVGNEIDEFVTGALRNNLLGLPLDLAALNIARGREAGVAPLNLLRNQIFSQTNDTNLKAYESWDDFGQFLKHSGSLVNFVAAYGTHDSITSATTLVDKRAAALDLVQNGTIGSATFSQDAYNFIHSTGAYANDATHTNALAQHSQWSTGSITGLDNVDLWIGGLAEKQNLFGGLLGSTFNFIFETQLEALQDADRLYYLPRIEGTHWGTEIEGNSFAAMIMGNTGTHHLSASIFLTPEYVIEAGTINKNDPSTWLREPTTAGADNIMGTADDVLGKLLIDVQNDGTIRFLGHDNFFGNTMVMGGTEGDDRLIAGQADDDTVWGDGGNDYLDGGNGNDFIYGGTGNDTVTDSAGDDVIHGDEGDDTLDGGLGADIILGGDGDDFINGGMGLDALNGGLGNDIMLGGEDDDEMLGNEGDDWMEGGDGGDLMMGDSGAPTGQIPLFSGNDVLDGGAGGDRMVGFSGDDIMIGEGGFEFMLGLLGWDWASFNPATLGVDADMTLVDLVAGNPALAADTIRTRFLSTEAISGSAHNDILRGTNVNIADVFNELNNPNLIFGLTDILGQTNDVLGIASYNPLGPVAFSNGNIMLGGAGSDFFQGRAGDDIIDGDAALHVSLTSRSAGGQIMREITNDGQAGDIDTAFYAGSIDQYSLNEVGVHYDPLFVGTGDFGIPIYLVDGFDTLGNPVLAGDEIMDYDFLQVHIVGTGVWHITDNGSPANAALGLLGVTGFARDGSDYLRNIERIEFGVFDDTHARFLDLGLMSVAGITFNAVPVGNLTIGGDADLITAGVQPVVGLPLNVVNGVIDADGLMAGTVVHYQWEALDRIKPQFVEIAGATGETFTPTNAFLGQTLRVHMSYVDGKGYTETVYSTPTTVVTVAPAGGNTAPTLLIQGVNTGLPDTSGRQGLSMNHFLPLTTTFVDAQTPSDQLIYTVKLASNGQVLDGSAEAYGLNFVTQVIGGVLTYRVTGAPQAYGDIDIRVTATDTGPGTPLTVTDVFRIRVSQPVGGGGTPLPTIMVLINDTTPTEDQLLTASFAFTSASNKTATGITYSWQELIGGVWTTQSTGPTYQPGDAQVGLNLRVLANYTDVINSVVATHVTYSASTLAVANINDALVGSANITGNATQNEILTADTSGISDADGLGPFTYQWMSGTSAIVGATSASYTLTNNEVGSLISVVVSYVDAHGTHESTTSAATTAVINVNDAPLLTGPQAVITGALEDAAFFVSSAQLLQGFIDPDGDAMTVTAPTSPGATVVAVGGANPGFMIMPPANFNGPLTLSYNVMDTNAASTPATLAYTVTPVDDPTTGTLTIDNTAPGLFSVLTVASNLSDVDGAIALVGYQWQSAANDGLGNPIWTDIPTASTAASYTTTTADANRLIRVIERYTVGGGPVETFMSAATAAVAGFITINGTAGNDVGTLLRPLAANIGISHHIFGLAGNDILRGGTAADLLDGGTGNDTMTGLAGNDIYVVDSAADVVVEAAGPAVVSGVNQTAAQRAAFNGIDTVESSALTYTLAANVENLTLTGIADISGTGNNLDNTIIGNVGNNTLDGDTGADHMAGGLGNDLYIVDNAGDVVTEAFNAGTDTISTNIDGFSLASFANVENLTLTGAAVTGTGNALDNVMLGNALDNTLNGGDGNDTLNGGTGIDTLVGGNGNDLYIVNTTTDIIVEAAGAAAGIDTISSSVTYSLNTANTANVENLILTGNNSSGTGNDLDNTLTGSNGNNTLDGGLGADTMSGGLGNDTYVVDNVGDVVIEGATANVGAGVDTIQSSVSITTLADNVENLTLTGIGNLNGTGNAATNTITGNAGNNVLNGGGGADTLVGGAGNDTYIVNNAGVTITETNALGSGTDTVQSTVSVTLSTNVENLTLTGGTTALTGTGNGGANVITANDAGNVLSGAGGADTLIGGAGNDTLIGGAGADTITTGAGNDIIVLAATGDTGTTAGNIDIVTDFVTAALNAANHDIIDLSAIDANIAAGNPGNQGFTWIGTGAFTAAGQLRYVQIGADTFVQGNVNNNLAADFSIQLSGLHVLGGADFVL
jgi:Ca2+-binding RTX toxin-like protein